MEKFEIWKVSVLLFLVVFVSACSRDESSFTASEKNAFVTTWKTAKANDSIMININANYASSYNYSVDWGDGTHAVYNTAAKHEYVEPGTYTVKITGDFPAIYTTLYDSTSSYSKIQSVENWGPNEWKSMDNAFYGCTNLVLNATDIPNLKNVTDMSYMFYSAQSLNQDISGWDVSTVTNMRYMFRNAKSFNQDLSNWDVSNVTNMRYMFSNASSFNQNISNWDVSNVTSMHSMFNSATSFNKNISNWDTGNVTTMNSMFRSASSFNQNISDWNVSSVTNMQFMFNTAIAFNSDISNWNVGNVTDLGYMFQYAKSFNQDLSGWNTLNVTKCNNFNYLSALETDNLPTLGCFN